MYHCFSDLPNSFHHLEMILEMSLWLAPGHFSTISRCFSNRNIIKLFNGRGIFSTSVGALAVDSDKREEKEEEDEDEEEVEKGEFALKWGLWDSDLLISKAELVNGKTLGELIIWDDKRNENWCQCVRVCVGCCSNEWMLDGEEVNKSYEIHSSFISSWLNVKTHILCAFFNIVTWIDCIFWYCSFWK